MDYMKSDDMIKKESAKKNGTRAFIREQLLMIPEGQGCLLIDLAKEILEARPNVKSKNSAYIRIGGVLKKGTFKRDFEKRTGDDGFTYVVALTETEREAVEFGL